VKRLQRLETIADSFAGVEKTYAVQAGREIRVMVKPTEIDDLLAIKLAHDTAKKIEEVVDLWAFLAKNLDMPLPKKPTN